MDALQELAAQPEVGEPMSPVVTITSVVSPAPRTAWAEVLAADPNATALQQPAYLDAVLAGAGGRDASRLYELSDGRRLVLPLVRTRSVPGLQVLADYPGGYGHGSLVATGGLRATDVELVVADLRTLKASIRIGGGHHTATQWAAGEGPGAVRSERLVDVVDLSDGWDAVYGRFHKDFRYHVRRAGKKGVEIELDTTGRLVPVFYDLYLDWVEGWSERNALPAPIARWSALRQEPRRKFEAVARHLGDKLHTFIAWHDGKPVASCLTYVHGQHAIGWRSYSIKSLAAPVSANSLVQSSAIQDACASGCRWFDLGQSGGAADLLRYKSNLGGEPRTVVDLQIEPPALSRARGLADQAKQRLINALSKQQD